MGEASDKLSERGGERGGEREREEFIDPYCNQENKQRAVATLYPFVV